MKNAGVELDDYLYSNITMEKVYKLHMSLVELLKNGIVPMNKLNVYHWFTHYILTIAKEEGLIVTLNKIMGQMCYCMQNV